MKSCHRPGMYPSSLEDGRVFSYLAQTFSRVEPGFSKVTWVQADWGTPGGHKSPLPHLDVGLLKGLNTWKTLQGFPAVPCPQSFHFKSSCLSLSNSESYVHLGTKPFRDCHLLKAEIYVISDSNNIPSTAQPRTSHCDLISHPFSDPTLLWLKWTISHK